MISYPGLKIRRIKTLLKTLFFVFAFCLPLFSQTSPPEGNTKSNLDIFYSLLDSASNAAAANIPSAAKVINLKFELGNDYSVFSNRIIKTLNKTGSNFKLDSAGGNSSNEINFVIDKAMVSYSQPFRKSLFGSYFTQREIKLGGNYLADFNKPVVNNFNYVYRDTVKVDEIQNLENASFPFTHGNLPAEPFLSSIYEPIIAIGTAALTVILFFTVRSK